MSAPAAERTHVMISSVMRGREQEREAVARLIETEGDVPWYADTPPREFSNIPDAMLAFRMAEACDLYLLILYPRDNAVFDGDLRSLTHQEFLHACEANPYKVEVFIAIEANLASDALGDLIAEVSNVREGYSPQVFASLAQLQEQVLAALVRWRADGNSGRSAYVRAMADEFRTFRNPVTGKAMDYSATVQLNLHARGELEAPNVTWEPPRISRELLAEHEYIIVIGDVGSGKTTLLKRMAHDAASGFFTAAHPRLPILVTATRLGRAALDSPGQSLAAVVGRIEQDDTHYGALRQTINRTISKAIHQAEALLLIDGLDEASAREQAAVFALLADVGENQAVLASRPSAFGNQLAGWRVADLQPLEPEQRRDLVLQVFRAETNAAPAQREDDALARLANRLLRDLDARETDLAVWAGNPLLLTLIAVQYLRDQRLPENRARVYEFALEDLQRQRPATARRELTERELETYLRLLALRMTHALRRETTVAEVRDTYLPGYGLSIEVAREILERSGVLRRDATALVDDEQTRYEFVHMAFREYLTACALAGMPEWQRHDLTRRHCLHQSWEQVLILLVNRLDLINRIGKADEVIHELIQADKQIVTVLRGPDPTHLALRMAIRCALSRGKLTSDELVRELQDAWLPIWRAEEKRLMTSRGFIEILDAMDVTAGVDAAPNALAEAMPILASRLNPRVRFPSSRWWLFGILVLVALLGLLYLVGQLTLSMGPLHASNWGIWLGQHMPYLLLVLLCALVIVRLYGQLAARSRTRREMAEESYRVDVAQLRAHPTTIRFASNARQLAALRLFRHSLRRALADDNAPTTVATWATQYVLSPKVARRLYRSVMRLSSSWMETPLRIVHWLTDWPLLVALALAQLALIFPAVTERFPLPPPIQWLFGLTAWWQVLLIAVLYAGFYTLTSFMRALIVYGRGRQRERVAMLDALESVIRRQVADTDSKTLVDGE